MVFLKLISFFSNTYPGDNCLSLQYDCSSADINPIGSISKMDLRTFLKWAAIHLGYSSLAEIEAAPPTAELEPIRANYSQVSDSVYSQFSVYDVFSSNAGDNCFLFLVFSYAFILERELSCTYGWTKGVFAVLSGILPSLFTFPGVTSFSNFSLEFDYVWRSDQAQLKVFTLQYLWNSWMKWIWVWPMKNFQCTEGCARFSAVDLYQCLRFVMFL